MPVDPREQKLAELILYVSQRSATDPHFGQVKLNKILFFSDFNAYGSWGETITGAEYQHLPQGPTVRRMKPVQQGLISAGVLALQPVSSSGFQQLRTVNLREADLSVFSAAEIALVDAWIERLRDLTAAQVSALSHETAGWQLTSDGETIDPRMVLLSTSKPTAAEIRRGLELAQAHGLLA